MKGEIWKDIEGWEGYYMVSNLGRVKSLNYKRTGKEGILKAMKNRDGYLQVMLHRDGKGKMYTVHKLVASAFCDNPHGFKEVNHLDEDKTNNSIENLEWCSRSYNNNYGTRNQRSAENRRNDPNRSKPVIAIDKVSGLILEFPSTKEAERVLRIDQSSITKCCKGKLNSCGDFYWMYADTDDAE